MRVIFKIPDGVLPVVPNPSTSYIVGEEGENILQIVKPDNTFVPLFEIRVDPDVSPDVAQEHLLTSLVERCEALESVDPLGPYTYLLVRTETSHYVCLGMVRTEVSPIALYWFEPHTSALFAQVV